MVICVVAIFYLVRHATNEVASINAKEEETVISLRPLEQVPFPAVILNLGGSIDPMGYVRNSGDAVKEEDFPEQGIEERPSAFRVFLMLLTSFAEMKDLKEVIFYEVYKLLWQDIQRFLLSDKESLLEGILRKGLIALEVSTLRNVPAGNRVQFLEKYVSELERRTRADLVEIFFELFCLKQQLYLSSPSAHDQYSITHLEAKALKGANIFSPGNLAGVNSVSHFCPFLSCKIA